MSKFLKTQTIVTVKTGDIVTAKRESTDYNLTENKKYQVLDFDGECILIMTDTGETEWFSQDYFVEFNKPSI